MSETTAPQVIVYKTRTGKTFHTAYCAMGSRRTGGRQGYKTPTTLTSAQRHGMTECPTCKPLQAQG